MVLLEAALYSAGRPTSLNDLKRIVGTRSDKLIENLIKDLIVIYTNRSSALEIRFLPEQKAVLQLRQDYSDMVKKISNRPLLSIGPLKTLSYVAYHQPVEQTGVIENRGNHAYGHLKQIEEMGLIIRERTTKGSYIINTTPYFSDYFGFSNDPAKSKLQLRQIFNQLKIAKLENGENYIPQIEDEENISANSGYEVSPRFTEYLRPSN